MSNRPYYLAIAGLLALAVGIQVARDRGWQPYEPKTPLLWVQPGPLTTRAFLGYESLAADIYWIRAVVYFGKQRLSEDPEKNYDLLFPLLDFVTSLDKRFTVAYRFGSIFLSEAAPGGPGRPDLAIELLQRGMERSPEKWEYPHDIGFIYYWSYRDYAKAAEWFQRASAIEGAPFWLKSTAATVLAEGGDRESARLLWRQLLDHSDTEWVKSAAAIRLAQLDAMDRIDALNEIVWRYEARTGRMPSNWQQLIAAGVLRGVPTDATGVPFEIDPVNEDVRVSRKSQLWPMPERMESSLQR